MIILLVHPDIARKAKNAAVAWTADPRVPRLADLHWILVKEITFPNGNVRLKISTWRWSGYAEFPIPEFMDRFHGYVIAVP